MPVSHQTRHKNKTIATLLAFLLGGLGLHRLYLGGWRDRWLWLHLSCLPAAWLVTQLAPEANVFYKLLPIMVSTLAGFLQALVLGLTPDDKWDVRHNAGSGRQSDTRWPVAVILVATMMIGTGSLIATISRLFDLLYTGGAYG
ncbi:NINE protein [Duganella sp. BuS-21]|uniref:NINE protein n=1 Tax=Duganella sp. BuS-21 TaxID=2943848 RepID=UPI0035A5B211